MKKKTAKKKITKKAELTPAPLVPQKREKETLSKPCKICGKIVTREFDFTTPEYEGEFGARLRAMCVKLFGDIGAHDACGDERKRIDREQLEATIAEERLTNWNAICPPLFIDTDEELLPDRDRHEQVMEWQFGERGLIVDGDTGRGKTRSIYLLLRREFLDGRKIIPITHLEFETKLMQGMGELWQERWLNRLSSIDILFFDDLGKVRFTTQGGEGRFSEQKLYEVFNKRIERRLPTIFTTENTGESLLALMSAERGKSFIRRMREFCDFITFR